MKSRDESVIAFSTWFDHFVNMFFFFFLTFGSLIWFNVCFVNQSVSFSNNVIYIELVTQIN